MSLFDPPLTFVNNDEDNYQQVWCFCFYVIYIYIIIQIVTNCMTQRSESGNDNGNNNGNNNEKLKSNQSITNGDCGDCGDCSNLNENSSEKDESSKTCVLTRTLSVCHNIRWEIDDRSIEIAKLATKADKRGVIEATVIKDGYDFKLELCASGWRSSQDGYCAFYLTVPNMTDTFVARYRVQVKFDI